MLTVISCNWAPGDAGNSTGQILGERSDSFGGEEDQFPTFWGAKAHANVLKVTFSSDCISNCIRIGRMWPRTVLFQRGTIPGIYVWRVFFCHETRRDCCNFFCRLCVFFRFRRLLRRPPPRSGGLPLTLNLSLTRGMHASLLWRGVIMLEITICIGCDGVCY